MNSELLKEDLLQIEQKGMNEAQIEAQLENFRNGFEFLKLKGAAAVGDGIIAPTEDEAEACIQAWNDYNESNSPVLALYDTLNEKLSSTQS